MLHTINKAPHSSNAFDACLRICGGEAAILLIEDGVLAALADSEAAARLCATTNRVYVLLPDAAARGLDGRIASGITGVDYAGFVQLCCEHSSVQSWY